MDVALKYYLFSLVMCILGMIAQGLVRPSIVFNAYEEYGLLMVSFLTAAFMFSRAFSSSYGGILVLSRGYRLVISIGSLMIGFTITAYMVFPPSLYPLIRVVEGFSAGLLWPLIQSLITATVPKDWRARALSLYFVLGSLSYNLGIFMGGVISGIYGIEVLFYTAFFMMVAMAFIGFSCTRDVRPVVGGRRYGFKDYIVFSRRIADLVPIIFIVGGVSGLSLDYLLAYSRGVTGISREMARFYWSYAGYLGLILSLVISYIADKWGGEKINYWIGVGVSISLIMISFPLPPIILYSLLSLPVIGSKIFKPIIRSTVAGRTDMPEISVALINSLSNIGAGFAPLIVTAINMLVGTDFNSGLLVYSLLSFMVMVYLIIRRKR